MQMPLAVFWILRVVGWDAILPSVVFLAPYVAKATWPDKPRIIECTAVLVPIAAFLLRGAAGFWSISSNHCSDGWRKVQRVAFCFGILALLLLECTLIATYDFGGKLGLTDKIFFCVLPTIYLAAMIFAMYPGRGLEMPDELERYRSQDEMV